MLAAEPPYPLMGGGALRTASLLHYLARTREVDLIVFRQPGDADPASAIRPGLTHRIVSIDLPETRRGPAARALRNASRLARSMPPLMDRFAGFGKQIEDAVGGRFYDVVVVEHFWCAPYLDWIRDACARAVIDLHNVESILHERCALTEAGPASFAHRLFHTASLELERHWLPRYDLVLAASEVDAGKVRSIAPGARVAFYPNAIPFAPQPAPSDGLAVVFSGNMEYHPNVSAVRFFRERIWPALRKRWPGLVWRLVGKNPEAVRRIADGDSRIEILGPVADAVQELSRACIAVVPLLAGSGTRFKILEAWAAGLPVVSTTIGAEGLPVRPGENILLADAPGDFAETVSTLLASPSLRRTIGGAGRCLLETEFTWESAWNKLDL